MLPASVVKSSAPTITGEPLIRPEPATIPSAAMSPPTSVPNSRNVPLSRRCSRRARASSLPLPWCLASRSVAAHRPRALDAEDRGLRASPSSPARSSCAIPVVERRSSHRRVHVDHTELLTVASTGMGTAAVSRSTAAVSSQLANVAEAAHHAGTTRLRRLLDRRDQPRPVPAAGAGRRAHRRRSNWAPASRWRSRAIR